VDDNVLDKDIEKGRGREGDEQRGRRIFARIAGFAGDEERGFKTSVGIDHEDDRVEPIGAGGWDGRLRQADGWVEEDCDASG